MSRFSKADVLLHAHALECFCQQVLAEIQQINSDTITSIHQKYLAIYNLIHQHDKQIAEVLDFTGWADPRGEGMAKGR